MKKIQLLFVALAFAGTAVAQTWSPDKNHSRIAFDITHLMVAEVTGNFKNWEAKITSSKDDLSDAVIEVSADVASVDTDNANRDADIQKEGFFDAAKYPKLTFKSTALTKVDGNKYKLKGDLTMKGVTKPVEFDAVISGPIEHPRSKKKVIGLKVTGAFKRTDFGVGQPGGGFLSEDVTLRAAGEFVKD